MGFYIELYCDTVECPHGADQEGLQGTNRATIAREAKAVGWRKVDGRWFCAGCIAQRLEKQ